MQDHDSVPIDHPAPPPGHDRIVDFDAQAHRYYLAGLELPSVTQVIGGLKLSPPYPKTESSMAAMNRGTKVHAMTERDDSGRNPLEDEELAPFLAAWREFRAAFGGWVDCSEMRVASSVYGYAGTLDRVFRSASGPLTVVDIKTGSESPWHRLQTAAYAIAFCEDGYAQGVEPENLRRAAVYLRPDGTYRLREHGDRDDLQGWRGAIILWHWKNKTRRS